MINPMQIKIDFRSGEPIYIQIMEQVRQMVAMGELQQGDQLPTVRQMATELRVNFNTVARAYRMLDEAGLISTQQGRGTYIWETPSEETNQRLRQQGLLELTQRYFDDVKRLGYNQEEVSEALKNQWTSWVQDREGHSKEDVREVTMNKRLAKYQKSDGKIDTVRVNSFALMFFLVFGLLSVLAAAIMDTANMSEGTIAIVVIGILLIGIYILFALKVAKQWEKAVVLRLGKFQGLHGPGMFWIIPIVDSTTSWIDHRVMVTPFNAEKTLTKDTVPVDVDAVLFWLVWDAEKAALEVEDYRAAIAWAAQTALREIIGQMTLADILVGRAKMDADLQKIIDERTTPWGVSVQSVEIRDVIIPQGLEDAMSQQAQAERERQSRVILGEAEMQVADSFAEASQAYINNPTALHLRAMNMLFEGLKEKGALVIVPSSAVDTMNLGGLSGLVAMGQNAQARKE